MKRYLTGLFFVLLAVVAVSPAAVRAETAVTTSSSVSASLTLLQNLMKQVEALQKQLAALRGEIEEAREELRDGLREGAENDDVKKIQELLATDSSIYPKGLISGFYGPLTADAVKAFQKRHELKVTGEVDAETKALMLEYFKEKTGGKIPPGLLKAPGIDKKIKDRLKKDSDGDWELDCDDKKAAGPLCKDKDKDHEHEEGEDEDEDDNRAKLSAERAITAAEDIIANLEEAIADGEDDDLVEDAEDELADAEAYLEKAETHLKDKQYTFAYSNAVKARRTAEKALDVLVYQDDTAAAAAARGMIAAAKDAISRLEDEIEDATDEDAIEDAEDDLAEVEDLLATAEEDYEDEEYRKSYDRALEAKMDAFKAIEDLEDAE